MASFLGLTSFAACFSRPLGVISEIAAVRVVSVILTVLLLRLSLRTVSILGSVHDMVLILVLATLLWLVVLIFIVVAAVGIIHFLF